VSKGDLSGVTVTLYIPKESIKKRDSVLVVDDMIKSGETQEALVNLVKKSKAEVSGIFSLIAVGEEWKKRLKSGEDSPVEVVTHLKSPFDTSI
jgi:adenine phosphoribosyltransferase